MRIKMTLDLTEYSSKQEDFADIVMLKEVCNMDLANLFYAGYHNSVDDEGESIADWNTIISQFKRDEFGDLIHEASLVIKNKDRLSSGIVVGKEGNNPYIIALATEPSYRKKGLASRLINASASILKAKYKEFILYVNKENTSAIRLYEKLGFKLVE